MVGVFAFLNNSAVTIFTLLSVVCALNKTAIKKVKSLTEFKGAFGFGNNSASFFSMNKARSFFSLEMRILKIKHNFNTL